MTSIKFCGLTRPEDAHWAAALGAAYAGVIFARTSKRRVTPESAREVFDAIADSVERVGVFDDAPVAEIAGIAAATALDIVQLHGSAGVAGVRQLRAVFRGQIWAVAGLDPLNGSLGDEAGDLAEVADAVLLDTAAGGITGGSGIAFDWMALAEDVHSLATRTKVIIAGGLSPENVGDAIRLLSPVTVDVSSGVEYSPGIKDHALMRSFAEAVRSAS
ncbi:MAG: phosphoribosylanthranilate isomerase [Gemmatimonadaceae bacterium]|nr:phosphoribosylanthranilate isomerase [Gemmatimonadaceae bacterium]